MHEVERRASADLGGTRRPSAQGWGMDQQPRAVAPGGADVPVDERRLEVIDSDSGERLYRAMREQARRGAAFRRQVRWMRLRGDLTVPKQPAATDREADDRVIDLRGKE